ncbi:Interferon-induced GTP-binding protein Mx1 [Talaromyces pinophilus]|nr:Interferon-induced GTP-binding protein Mx1 [Talaromyces pinophilus]
MGLSRYVSFIIIILAASNSTNFNKAALQDAAGAAFSLPHRDGSPSTTTIDPVPGVDTIDVMTKDMRALVKKIQDLRHLGIEDSKIALPKICVVGDQSTGKSSLIEGMSEINVPRSAGTCTRCPMEINLSESDQPWKCEVTLSYSYTYSTKGGLRKITKANKLGPWYETAESQDVPFLTLHSKNQVQDAIKRAQLAILNPHKDPAEFLPSSSLNIDDATAPVKFSPNVVRLDISAPHFPNLAFYDLPGVISQAEHDEEAYLVTLVENLVKHYVAQKNCIILLTLPMTDDATNSSAARIVREIKATDRTLGVLTKPDRVEDIAQWADLLTGHKFHLGHGYYVVRNNPNPNVEHRQARMEEAQFFSTEPWTTALAPFQLRLGTFNLQNALSQLLIDQIKDCLPDVEKKIREKALRIHDELRELPEPVNQNTFYVLCTKLQDLKSAISACLEGGSKDMPMLKLWNRIAQDFASAIQRTRPDLRLLTEQEDFRNDDEPDCEIMEINESKQSPKRKLTPQEDAGAASTKNFAVDYTEHFQRFTKPERTFDLEEIRSINEDCSSGPTAHLHPKAVERVHGFSVCHWERPMRTFVDVTFKQVKKAIMAQVKSVLVAHQETELYRQVSDITLQFLQKMKDNVHSEAGQLYTLETTQFVANDRDALQKWGSTYYNDFKKARKEKKVIVLYRSRGVQLPSDRAKYEKAIEAIDFGCDPFMNELKLMAAAHAHYKVASSRFIDNICMIIHSKLFSECKENLFKAIEKGIGIWEVDASSRCLELMADDPERLQRRAFLLKDQEKLETALQWLGSTVTYNDPSDEDVEMSHTQEGHIKPAEDD